MAIDKGNIKTSVNYKVTAQKPLEARSVRPTKADLYEMESWEHDEDTVYIHEGQITYTEQEKKLFVLKDVKNFESEEAWAQILTTDDEIQGGGSDITVDTAMSDSSTNPVQNRVVKKYVDDAINNIPPQEPTVDVIDNLDSTDTEAALSANQGRILNEKIEAVASEATKIFNVKGSCKYSELPTTNNAVGDVYNITDSFTIGSENYPAGTNVVWDGNTWDALGGSIDLSAYATTETVVAMVQEETDRARGAEAKILNDIITIKANVAKKVDKEDGKGLSDENFTSALKKKLNELENYDDSALQTKVASLQNQLDALTNDDSIDEVIAKYEELKAFLEGLGNDEYGAFIEEISNQIAELSKGLTNTNKRIDSVEERLEDLASEIVIDEKEVYIGAEQPADAKIWIDTDEDYPEGGGTGGGITLDSEMSDTSTNAVSNKVIKEYVDNAVANSGGGTGGGLETRILYVPELTAGSELTDEQKAYNAETCQKLLAGTARALISLGGIVGVVAESAINLSALGGVGTLVDFNWTYAAPIPAMIIGDDGDILMTMESAMSPIKLSEEGTTDSTLYWSLLYSAIASKIPMIWFDFKGSFWLATKCDFSTAVVSFEAVCKDIEFQKPLNATLKVLVSTTSYVVTDYKTTQCIYVGQSLSSEEQSYNSIWMDSLSNTMSVEKPMVRISGNDETEYSLIGFTKHTNEGNANVIIYRNGAFETWRINKDGATTQITE